MHPAGRKSYGGGNGKLSVVSLFPRIGGLDDDADGFLVEPFEPALALQVFEVAANRSFADELIELLLVNQTCRSNRSARSRRTGHRSPSVKACFKKGKSENGFMVLMLNAAICSRSRL